MRPSSKMWTRCCLYRRNRSRPEGTSWNKSCVMEIRKTAAHADGKPIHGLWKRTGLSHSTANRFPTAPPDMAVYTHSHNAYYGDYPSYPILSYPILSYPILSYPILSYPILILHGEKEKKAKKMGAQPTDKPRKLCSRFVFKEVCENQPVFLYLKGKGQHRKSRNRRFICPSLPLISTVFRISGEIIQAIRTHIRKLYLCL